MAFPIVLYSIYYQAVIIRKWCFLCLSIVTILCCKILLSITFFQPTFNLQSILITLFSFSITSAFYLIESKIFKENKSLLLSKLEYQKFKRNFELFKAQYDKGKTIDTQITQKEEIILGNVKSPLNIIVITNPLCGHCRSVHNIVEHILKTYSKSLKLTIRFNINSKNSGSIATKIACRLLEIFNEKDSKTCLLAMHEIYSGIPSEQWFKKWGYCSKPENYMSILSDEYNWCAKNAINFTPEILINGKPYPKMFDRNDLIYFIENIEEEALITMPKPKPPIAEEV